MRTMAYMRDASWRNSIGRAHAYHFESERHPSVAACNRYLALHDGMGAFADTVPFSARCRRSGCRQRWAAIAKQVES